MNNSSSMKQWSSVCASSAMIFASALATLAVVATTASCGGEFDPGSRITNLRVLAVGADVPYAHPGETVNLETLADDPAGRPLTYGYSYCINPIESTPQGCIAQLLSDAEKSGVLPTFTFGLDMTKFVVTVPSNLLDGLPPAARPNAMVGVITVACPGTLTLTPAAGLPYTCTDASGHVLGLHDAITGMKRIFVRSKDRNENPAIASVTFDGKDWPESEIKTINTCDFGGNTFDDCGTEKHLIAAISAPGAIESGTDEFGTAFVEQVVVQYYGTDGLFQDAVRVSSKPETGFAARRDDAGKNITLWLVLRDDRGGVSWVTRKIKVN